MVRCAIVTADPLAVIFSSANALRSQLPHLARQTCFVPVPEPEPQSLATFEVVLCAGEQRATFSGRVLQVMAGVGLALECTNAPALAAWIEEVAASLPDTGADTRARWGLPDGDGDAADDESDDAQRASVRERIQEMSTNEKLLLALHGTKLERTILLKDPNKNIQSYIIRNRKITLDEIRYLAGFRQANPDVLKQIAESREWTQNPRIVSALVGNPKTPATLAHKLLSKLPITEVRRLAKSPNTPRAIAVVAKKMVAGG